MYRYILKRLAMLIPVLIGVLLIIFILSEITPGDAARQLAGEFASEEDVEAIREQLGLNKPFLERFGRYVWGLITRLDLGTSYQTSQPVSSEIFARFPTTLLLALVSMLFAVGLGIPAGIISATRQYSLIDNISMVTALLGVSMPNFWQGLMNIIVFSIWLKWLPASGFYGWQYWILPALTIGTSSAALLTRMTRSSMLEVIRQDYIRTARANGLSEGRVILRHTLKNALIPVITIIGLQMRNIVAGAVVIENIFNIPGVGQMLLNGIMQRDYFMAMACVLVISAMTIFCNLFVDLAYGFIDPRVRKSMR